MVQVREDLATMAQGKQEIKEVARHFSEKYKEANEVLKLQNEEKNTLV